MKPCFVENNTRKVKQVSICERSLLYFKDVCFFTPVKEIVTKVNQIRWLVNWNLQFPSSMEKKQLNVNLNQSFNWLNNLTFNDLTDPTNFLITFFRIVLLHTVSKLVCTACYIYWIIHLKNCFCVFPCLINLENNSSKRIKSESKKSSTNNKGFKTLL